MKQQSLKARILFLVVTTVLFLAIMAGIQINDRLERHHAAEELGKALQFYVATSETIQEIQKERGKSALFLNSKIDESDLKTQMEVVNKKRDYVLPTAEALGEFVPKSAQDLIQMHDNLRKSILSKNIKAPESTAQFSEMIGKFIDLQADVAHMHNFNGLEDLLTSQAIFETSKEYMGRLRATMNGILSADEPISSDLENKLYSLKTSILVNLYSKGISFEPETKRSVEKIFETEEWKFVDKSIDTIHSKAHEGKYGVDPVEFSKKITFCIDSVFKVLSEETSRTAQKIEDVKSKENRIFWSYMALVSFVVVFCFGFSYVITTRLNQDLTTVVKELDAGIEVILNSSKEIAASSSMLSSSSTQQAASLEETVSSIEDVSSMVTINSTHASESAKLSGVSQKQAQSGEEMMTNLVQVMNEISEASKKIQDITSVIDDIAFQTNLLALNAAVEAARAGEQGKGFAVVADAVRSLAQRSAEAAKDISAMISGSVGKIQSGVDVVQQNSGLLHEIVDSISKVSSINSDIASSSQDQSVGLQQINQAMNQLDQATQGNASAAERLAQTSSSMENQVETFQNVIVTLRKIVNGESKAS